MSIPTRWARWSEGLRQLWRVAASRSLENPATPLSDPDDWLYEGFGGTRTDSGVRVNRRAALTYAAIWRGVSLIAATVAKVPLVVYRRADREGRERATDHPAYSLLRSRPNPEMTAFAFRELLTTQAVLQGNGYAYIYRARNGKPLELIPLDPQNTYPVRVAGEKRYVTKVGTETRSLDPSDVLHIHGFSWDGMMGLSLVAFGAESIGLGIAQQRYARLYYRHNARPSLAIEHPTVMPPEQRRQLALAWDQMHAGLENSHRPVVLDRGAKVNPMSINAHDSQLIESRQFEIREIANWLGLPPHKLGDTTRTAFASLEQENQSLIDDGYDPWFVRWETECAAKLLSPSEQSSDTYFVETLRVALNRTDATARNALYNGAIQNGWMSRNEVRARENLPPIPGGDEFLVPLNMRPTGGAPDSAPNPDDPPKSTTKRATPPKPPPAPRRSARGPRPKSPPAPSADPEAHARQLAAARTALEQALARMVRRITTTARRNAAKDDLPAQINSIESDHDAIVSEALTPLVNLVEALGIPITRDNDPRTNLLPMIARELWRTIGYPRPCTTEDACAKLETELPAQLARQLFDGPQKGPNP